MDTKEGSTCVAAHNDPYLYMPRHLLLLLLLLPLLESCWGPNRDDAGTNPSLYPCHERKRQLFGTGFRRNPVTCMHTPATQTDRGCAYSQRVADLHNNTNGRESTRKRQSPPPPPSPPHHVPLPARASWTIWAAFCSAARSSAMPPDAMMPTVRWTEVCLGCFACVSMMRGEYGCVRRPASCLVPGEEF